MWSWTMSVFFLLAVLMVVLIVGLMLWFFFIRGDSLQDAILARLSA
jgi:hypothetical protein